ncbi:MAG: hypothetical protein WD873_07645 [Candidatus Hydrogenedentales bacterium]
MKIQFFLIRPKDQATAWKLFKVWFGVLIGSLLGTFGVALFTQEQPRYYMIPLLVCAATITIIIRYFVQRRTDLDSGSGEDSY